jgi:hypothetical protein
MDLKNLVKSAGIGIKPHATIEENKRIDAKQQHINPSYISKYQAPPLLIDNVIEPKKKRVAQVVAQTKPQAVAQVRPQAVAQTPIVAQVVAQVKPQTVAQYKPQTVAHEQVIKPKPQRAEYISDNTLVDLDIQKFKEQIYLLPTVEDRKKYCLSIGFGIATEKRSGSKQIYLYGIKKIAGRKYRLYIGNSKNI